MKTTGHEQFHPRIAASGVTLIELMVTLTVASILVTVGVPSFRTFVQDNRRSSQVYSLIRALQSARSDAITRQVPVTVCPGIATSATTGSCTNTTAWGNKGWIVFVDKTSPIGSASSDELLHVFPALEGGNKLIALLGKNYITYEPNGLSDTSGSFTLCDERGADYSRGIEVTATGQVRPSDPTASC